MILVDGWFTTSHLYNINIPYPLTFRLSGWVLKSIIFDNVLYGWPLTITKIFVMFWYYVKIFVWYFKCIVCAVNHLI